MLSYTLMSYIDDILAAEKESERLIEEGKHRGEEMVQAARAEAREIVMRAEEEVAREREHRRESQKRELARVYRETVERGKREADLMQAEYNAHIPKAARMILSRIIKEGE